LNFQIVELEEFSGEAAAIYSVLPDGSDTTLFDDFLSRHQHSHRGELRNIIERLEIIGKETGARAVFFKEKEGKPGDGVCALYDNPDHRLRLYCIRYGSGIIILGDGAPKPKDIRAWQEDDALSRAAIEMIEISQLITERIKIGEIKFGKMGGSLEGNLSFDLAPEDE
jgi:hypothetical protein